MFSICGHLVYIININEHINFIDSLFSQITKCYESTSSGRFNFLEKYFIMRLNLEKIPPIPMKAFSEKDYLNNSVKKE